jgi:hypothetical protein
MPGTSFDSEPDFDAQDHAETFDESMTLGDEEEASANGELEIGEDVRSFEEAPDVYDVTAREGDRDEDEALALDAGEFDDDAISDEDTEDDDELDYAAADAEHEDDLDGLGGGPGGKFDEDQLSARDIEGLEEVRDAGAVSGGEDDVSNFQSKGLGDEDLRTMGYAERRSDETRAKK